MIKIIKNGEDIIVIVNGMSIQTRCTEESYKAIVNAKTEDEIFAAIPQLSEHAKKQSNAINLFDRVAKSKYLCRKADSIYFSKVSDLSLPADLVNAILSAEETNNEDALEAYKNFWTLMSLNPDSRCRENLFWFLNKWGMKISKSGLFIGYRNVDIYQDGTSPLYSQKLCDFVKEQYAKIKGQKKSPVHYWVDDNYGTYSLINEDTKLFEDLDGKYTMYNLDSLYKEFKAVNFIAKNCGDDTIYTDHYSHTFKIEIGKLVTMPRNEVDCEQVSCSRGLHLGGQGWLNKCYFGVQGLVCLCNPAKVCAVPRQDDYGKLRTCEYLPIALCEYDDNGNVIPYNVEDGFDSKWVTTVLYSGELGTEDDPLYKLEIPEMPEINKSTISNCVYEIARKYINK